MAGIVVFDTQKIEELHEFYTQRAGFQVWEIQKDLLVLREGNLLVGFHPHPDRPPTLGTLRIWLPSPTDLEERYQRLQDVASQAPTWSTAPRIYMFTARDPEGRVVHFHYQPGIHLPFFSSDRLLVTRRSIREFTDDPVPDELLWKVLELSRFAPTSRNSQSYTYWVIRDRKLLNFLGQIRKESDPIARAPMAIAVTADPQKSKRYEQDAVIAAYHLMLAAWTFGLGTCWIAAMNRPDVKEALGIPMDHYVATVTPLGFPKSVPEAPSRRPAEAMVRFVNTTE